MINAIVQNGAMQFLDLTWRLRRLIILIAALAVLAVSVDMHPGSAHVVVDTGSEITHIHDDNGENRAELSHKSVHHDHHTEFAYQTEMAFLSPSATHEGSADQSDGRQVRIALDRPPNATQC